MKNVSLNVVVGGGRSRARDEGRLEYRGRWRAVPDS